jgi:hypothetical protein
MNNVARVLLFCGITIGTIQGYAVENSQLPDGRPGIGENMLNTGILMDEYLFNYYNPIIKKLCEDFPDEKNECKLLFMLARNVQHGVYVPKDKIAPAGAILLKAKLVYSDGTIKPEIREIVLAALEQRKLASFDNIFYLKYHDPLWRAH